MREIKFRGQKWDADLNRLDFVYGYLTDRDVIKDKLGNSHVVWEDSVGQYTGLKDKNGKDIYEGDIIAISSRGFDFDCQVTYDKQLIPVGEKSKGWEHMLYSPYWEECVIIGNIHEKGETK